MYGTFSASLELPVNHSISVTWALELPVPFQLQPLLGEGTFLPVLTHVSGCTVKLQTHSRQEEEEQTRINKSKRYSGLQNDLEQNTLRSPDQSAQHGSGRRLKAPRRPTQDGPPQAGASATLLVPGPCFLLLSIGVTSTCSQRCSEVLITKIPQAAWCSQKTVCAPTNSTVSLSSQRHNEKLSEVKGTS